MTGEKRKREPWSGRRRVAGFLILALCCMSGAAGGVYISHRKAPDKTEGLAYEAISSWETSLERAWKSASGSWIP